MGKQVAILIELDDSRADPDRPRQLTRAERDAIVAAVESIGARLVSGPATND